jgi:hypothetical protein
LGHWVLGISLSALSLSSANATPIKPDMKKLLAAPPGSTIQFAPARAGWNGPEAPTAERGKLNPELARITPAAARLEMKNAILSAVIPDPRVTVSIILAILVLRRMLKSKAAQPQAGTIADTKELRPAA